MPDSPKPWEEYQAGAPAAQGTPMPWEEYQSAPAAAPSSGGLLSTVSSALRTPGNAVRAGVGALEGGQGFLGAYHAAADQFGDNPPPAPTGEDLIKPLGIKNNAFTRSVEGGLLRMAHIPVSPDAFTPEKAAGLVAENVTDPMMYAAEGAGVVGKALKRNIVIKPILDSLAESKAALNPKIDAEAIQHIDALVSQIKGPNWVGKVDKDRLGEISNILQSHAVDLPTQASADAANRASVVTDNLVRQKSGGVASRAFDAAKNKVAGIFPEENKYGKMIKKLTPGEVAVGAGALVGREAGKDAAPDSSIAPWLGGIVGGAAGMGSLGLLSRLGSAASNPAVIQSAARTGQIGLLANRLQNQGLLSK